MDTGPSKRRRCVPKPERTREGVTSSAVPTPLEDILVLDLTRAVAGPIAGRLLADLGARVVKVEPPDADLTRFVVPHVDGFSAYFAQARNASRWT